MHRETAQYTKRFRIHPEFARVETRCIASLPASSPGRVPVETGHAMSLRRNRHLRYDMDERMDEHTGSPMRCDMIDKVEKTILNDKL
jgi:hypothetical protein